MAYPTLSTESRILRFLATEDATVMFLSALASIRGIRGGSQSRLFAMTQGKALEPDAYRDFGVLIGELEHLRDRIKPIPIRFRDAQIINDLLKSVESGEVCVLTVGGKQNESNS